MSEIIFEVREDEVEGGCVATALGHGIAKSFAARCALILIASLAIFSAVCAADALERIKREGVLKWGADAEGGAPYVFPDPQKPERLIGFEVDLAEALAGKLGVRAEMVQNQ